MTNATTYKEKGGTMRNQMLRSKEQNNKNKNKNKLSRNKYKVDNKTRRLKSCLQFSTMSDVVMALDLNRSKPLRTKYSAIGSDTRSNQNVAPTTTNMCLRMNGYGQHVNGLAMATIALVSNKGDGGLAM